MEKVGNAEAIHGLLEKKLIIYGFNRHQWKKWVIKKKMVVWFLSGHFTCRNKYAPLKKVWLELISPFDIQIL